MVSTRFSVFAEPHADRKDFGHPPALIVRFHNTQIADRVLSYWQKTAVLCLGRSLSTHFDCSGGFRNIMENAVL